MKTYADTGFIVSLYKKEVTSARAAALMTRQTESVGLSQLSELEFRNALHLSVFRGALTANDATDLQRLFDEDVTNGIFVISPIPSHALFTKAMKLADRYSAALGTRSLDLMHVAAALLLKAEIFLSFDERQRKAAKAEGLIVPL